MKITKKKLRKLIKESVKKILLETTEYDKLLAEMPNLMLKYEETYDSIQQDITILDLFSGNRLVASATLTKLTGQLHAHPIKLSNPNEEHSDAFGEDEDGVMRHWKESGCIPNTYSVSSIYTNTNFQNLGIGELMLDLIFYYCEAIAPLSPAGITTDFEGGNTAIINYIIKSKIGESGGGVYYKQSTSVGNQQMDFFGATTDPDDDCYSELFDDEGVYELVIDQGYTEEEAYAEVGYGSSYDEKFPFGTTSSWRKRGIQSMAPVWEELTSKALDFSIGEDRMQNKRLSGFRDAYDNTPTPEEIRQRQKEKSLKEFKKYKGKGDNPCWDGYRPGAKSGRKTKKGKSGKTVANCEKINEGDPAKGTGKKPKGSGRRLYTDENPKDTVPVKFRTKSDIQKTFSSAAFKSKDHNRQSQIINLVHQRVRAAYQNAKDPDTKKRLKKAYDYAKKRKEASKKKTQRMRKKK